MRKAFLNSNVIILNWIFDYNQTASLVGDHLIIHKYQQKDGVPIINKSKYPGIYTIFKDEILNIEQKKSLSFLKINTVNIELTIKGGYVIVFGNVDINVASQAKLIIEKWWSNQTDQDTYDLLDKQTYQFRNQKLVRNIILAVIGFMILVFSTVYI